MSAITAGNVSITYENFPVRSQRRLIKFNKWPVNQVKYDEIKGIYCCENGISMSNLPELPMSLEMLWCAENNLSQIPDLPECIKLLVCYSNPLYEINVGEYSTPELHVFVANNTNICEVNDLSGKISKLYLGDTNLMFLSEINFKHAKRIWNEKNIKLDLKNTPFINNCSNSYDILFGS